MDMTERPEVEQAAIAWLMFIGMCAHVVGLYMLLSRLFRGAWPACGW